MASMTYLQLAQLTVRLMRTGNAVGGTAPAAIPAPAGAEQSQLDAIDAVPRAWEYIQNLHPSWEFMRKQGSIATTVGQRAYTLAQLQALIPDYNWIVPMYGAGCGYPYLLVWDGSASQRSDNPYPLVPYYDWRGFYDRQPRPSNGQPVRFTERPDRTLEMDPAPAASPSGGTWRIDFDYHRTNDVLVTDTQVPILPVEFHELIAYQAAKFIAETRQSPLPMLVQQGYKERLDRLKAKWLPKLLVNMTYA